MPTQRSTKAGLPPGSVVFLGEQRVATAAIRMMVYQDDGVAEYSPATPAEARDLLKPGRVGWINITGLHDTELIRQAGDVFNIHPLVLEDIVNTGQRPKFEDHGDSIFCVTRMLYHRRRERVSEQVSFFLIRDTLVTFQEMEGDVFGGIRQRIRESGGRIRQRGADYLAYALLDAIIDHYFVVLETLDDQIESLQQKALDAPVPETLRRIHRLKRELISIRRQLWPLREAVGALQKSENPILTQELAPYWRDLYEHVFQVLDTLETMREMIASALETYMSSVSNRMNEIMKVLTVISTMFIPLTFIAGIYGMNFEHMPELRWTFGYAGVWIVMGLITTGMLLFFKRKSWF